MKPCPTCGRSDRRGTQAAADLVRTITCWACGKTTVQQRGPGRPWKTCRDPKCMAARRAYQRRGEAALDRLESA